MMPKPSRKLVTQHMENNIESQEKQVLCPELDDLLLHL